KVLESGKGPWLARYTDNHDEGRGLHRFGEGAVRAVEQLVFLTGHCIPFLLTGQEFGALNRPSIHERMSDCDKGPAVVVKNAVSLRPGIEFEGNIFARGRESRLEWYDFYKKLIRLRLELPELREGDFKLIDAGEQAKPSEKSVIAFERSLEKSVIRCAVNLGSKAARLDNADLFAGNSLYGSIKGNKLAAFSAVVVRGT
ncbi:DUF3459 domain-containing protein, partial [PVC group bacterium]|nr:DUF3459 domain-containing protein [PVC group bacterium]